MSDEKKPVSPAAFISERIKQFGVLGSNNRLPDEDRGPKPLPAPTFEFTKGNHFRFGFDGAEFNRRLHGSSTYWVDYGKASRAPEGFHLELRRAITEIFQKHGKMTITNSGNHTSRAVIFEAKRLGVPFEQITVQIEGYGVPYHDKTVPHRVVKVSWNDFAEFSRTFSKTAGCSDPWLALEAYHGHVSELPHIYCNTKITFVHMNYDHVRDEVVGPPVWCVADHEQSTGINRWLLATNKVGIPQIMFWSPELLVAQVTAEPWRDRMRRASLDPPQLSPLEVRWNTYVLFKTAYPKLGMAATGESARNDKTLLQPMEMLMRSLRRANMGYSTMHYFPLHRFMERLGASANLLNFGPSAKLGPAAKIDFGGVNG
jgi:hypothetical protein